MTTPSSPRVHVVVHLKLQPGALGRALEVFKQAVGPTRAEAGCLRYELFRSLEDPLRFVLVEEWRDREALDAHLKEPHIVLMASAFPGVLAEPLTVQTLTPVG